MNKFNPSRIVILSGGIFMSKNNLGKDNKWILIIKSVIMLIISSAIFMAVFSALMYFLELDKDYSPIFATISVAIGCFITAYYASGKIGQKGLITGLVIGLSVFILITVISLIVDKGSVTFNTLFHFIIFVLSSLIGGVMGVNKKGKKYI